jgi:V/A-type H+-transporting ATPase subunit E
MDVQLQELIEKIKAEGVKAAEEDGERIRKEAQKRAEQIVAQAHSEAADLVRQARAETTRFEQTAREALRQAGRNTILSLRARITEMFRRLIEEETRQALTGNVLQEAIVTLIKNWSKQQLADLEVLLPPAELEKIDSALRGRLGEELRKGVEIKPLAELKAGFRVGMKDGSAYYNFTDQGIAEILSEYVNPRLSEIIQEAVGNGS